MRRGRCVLSGVLTVALILLRVTAVAAQDYPSSPIEIIVPWGTGGGADQVARRIAKLLEPQLGVPVKVRNTPGHAGRDGLEQMLAAQADGYTLSILTGDTFGRLAVRQQERWLFDEITPIAVLMQQASGLLVHSNGRFKTWAEVESAAKSEVLRVAISGPGSADELTVNFLMRAGLKMVTIAFAKPGERHTAVLAGHAELLYEQIGDVRTFVENQQMRPILLFAEKRDPRLKDVPTSVELNYNVTLPQFRALIARSAVNKRVREKLERAVAEAASHPDYAAFLADQYADPLSLLPGEKALAFLQDELKALQMLAAEQNAMVGR